MNNFLIVNPRCTDRRYIRSDKRTIDVFYEDGVVAEKIHTLHLTEDECDCLMEDLYSGEYDGG